jgi:hypothetical protein
VTIPEKIFINFIKKKANASKGTPCKDKTINTTKALEDFKGNKKKPCQKKEFK